MHIQKNPKKYQHTENYIKVIINPCWKYKKKWCNIHCQATLSSYEQPVH